jgi:hypothetical protein
MGNRAGLDQESDLRGIELSLGVVFGVPVDFDGWQMLDGIVICIFRNLSDGLFV